VASFLLLVACGCAFVRSRRGSASALLRVTLHSSLLTVPYCRRVDTGGTGVTRAGGSQAGKRAKWHRGEAAFHEFAAGESLQDSAQFGLC